MQGVSRNMGIVFGTFKAPTTNLNWQNVCNCRSETLVQAVGSAGNWQGGKRTKTERERDDAEPFVESKNPQILNQLLLKCWLQSNSTTLVTRKHFPRSGERQQIFKTTWSDYVISWFDSIFPGSYRGDFFQCELCPVIWLMEEKWANQFIGTFTYLAPPRGATWMVKGSIKQPLRVQTAVLIVIPGAFKSPDLWSIKCR